MSEAAAKAFEKYQAAIGEAEGVGEWFEIDQERINQFADVTIDHQFIHIDPEAAKATPFGTTIAHGFLTLSLLSAMGYQVCPYVEGARYPLNYGFNRLRFVSPVPTGSRVRGRFVLRSAQAINDEQRQLLYDATVEIDGGTRPALAAEWLTRFVM